MGRLFCAIVHMPEFIPVLTKEEIEERVARLARTISLDYRGKELILVGVLKGAFVFLSDLARQITVPVKIDFVETSAYGDGTVSSGRVTITKKIGIEVAGKDVLLIEDIIDTGLTMTVLIDYIKSLNPKTVRVCALVSKSERRQVEVTIDYTCYAVEKGFLIGYGLDYADDYRNLPQIYELKL